MLFAGLDTATVLLLCISVVIPLLSSLLAKQHWPSELVGILTLLLSTLGGFLVEWQKAGSSFHFRTALGLALTSFIVAVFGRLGLWKGTQTDAKLLAVGSKSPPSS